MFVDKKKTQRIVAVESKAEPAASFLEIGEQPAFAVEIANVLKRRRELGVVPGRSRRDAFPHQGIDAIDKPLLVWSEAEVQKRFLMSVWSGIRHEGAKDAKETK